MCAASILVGLPLPGNVAGSSARTVFIHRHLRFSLYHTASVRILLNCCTRIQYVALTIALSDSSERINRDKTLRMHAVCCIATRGSCCTKSFAEFNANCESYCSLEQLVASLCAALEGKSATGTYYPKTKGFARRYLCRLSGLLCCERCTSNTRHYFFSTNSSRTVDYDRSERFLFR